MNETPLKMSIILAMFGLATQPGFAGLSIKTEALGNMPPPAALFITDMTPDGNHLAMAIVSLAGGQTITLDGRLVAQNPICGMAISPNGAHYAYATRDNVGFHIVADGVRGADQYEGGLGFDHRVNIHFVELTFSPDSLHLGFIANAGKEHFVVIDGKPGPHFPTIYPLAFSPDSHHWAYAASDDEGKDILIKDGNQDKTFNHIIGLTFSPQNELAFYARADGLSDGVFVNEKPVGKISLSPNFAFSADGKHLGYGDCRRQDASVVVDGQSKAVDLDPATLYPPIIQQVALSHDGKNVAYIRADATGPPKGDLQNPPPDAPVMKGIIQDHYTRDRAVWNDVPGPVVEKVLRLSFSPDGSRLAYSVRDAGKYQVITGTSPDKLSRGQPYDMVSWNAVFSPDGKHLAYAARKDGKWMMVLDGQEIVDYQPLHNRFQEDNDPYPPGPGFCFSFDPDGSLAFIASKDELLFRVHARL